jgi:hypothetical protein
MASEVNTCNTISRWIKNVLCLSGINTDIFKAHSTRSAATCAVFIAGIPIVDILKTDGWTSECKNVKIDKNRFGLAHVKELLLRKCAVL